MNCQEFLNVVREFLPDGIPEEAAAHMAECRRCALLLERQRAVVAGLRMLGAELRSGGGASARVEARLLKAFGRTGSSARRQAQHWWAPVALWASAAAATVLMAVTLLQTHRPAGTENVPGAPPVHRTVRSVQLAGVFDQEPWESAEFIALPNAPAIDTTEGMDVVRLELPRSAMAAVGYVVSPERASETVEADVVLGADGLARAVRFVNE
jgi:hypothetical protein